MHAFSALNAPKSCANLVPNDIVEALNRVIEAFQDVVEARNEVIEAFCFDNLVPSRVGDVRNEVSGVRRVAEMR